MSTIGLLLYDGRTPFLHLSNGSGVILAGILGVLLGVLLGLMHKAWWRTRTGGISSYRRWTRGGARPPPGKNDFFTWNGVFWYITIYQRYFLSVFSLEKCWIFRLKCWFGERWRSTFMQQWILCQLWGSQVLYCSATQAIWCLKFWNMTKHGGQFALASPIPNSGKLVHPSCRDFADGLDICTEVGSHYGQQNHLEQMLWRNLLPVKINVVNGRHSEF